MKKIVVITCIVASLILIFDSIGIWHMMMMFLFAGIIPGTNFALTSAQMIVLIAVLFGLIIVQIGILPLLHKKVRYLSRV